MCIHIYIYIYIHIYSDIFPGKMTNKYCGDLRRRRIRAKTAQNISKLWLVEFPSAQVLNNFRRPEKGDPKRGIHHLKVTLMSHV